MSRDVSVGSCSATAGAESQRGGTGTGRISTSEAGSSRLARWSVVKDALKNPRLSLGDMAAVVVAVALASIVRILLDPFLGDRAPHAPYLVAVVLIAWSRGFWSALLTVLLGALLANYLFIPPRFSLVDHGLDHHLATIMNLFVGVITAILSESIRGVARENAKLYQLARE